MVKELIGPPIPPLCRDIWKVFCEMARGYAEGGVPLKISNVELAAYQEVEGRRFSPWELMALRALDRAFLKIDSEARKKEQSAKKAAGG